MNWVTVVPTAVIAIIGWTFAIILFLKQHERNLLLKRKDYELNCIKDFIPFVEEHQKRNSEYISLLMRMREGIFVRSKTIDFTNHYFDDLSLKHIECRYAASVSFSNFLYFFDHRQYVRKLFEDKIMSIINLNNKIPALSDQIQEFIRDVIQIKINTKGLFTPEESEHINDITWSLIDLLNEKDSQISELSIAMQSEFLYELYRYKLTSYSPTV